MNKKHGTFVPCFFEIVRIFPCNQLYEKTNYIENHLKYIYFLCKTRLH